MKLVVQRVQNATLKIKGKVHAEIGKGLVVFVGYGEGQENEDQEWFANKLAGLRIFEDENGKMNVSAADAGGEMLLVSNFTLYGDCSRGFRPSFSGAMKPEIASKKMDEFFTLMQQKLGGRVKCGVFGAEMHITQTNDGPVTLIIDN